MFNEELELGEQVEEKGGGQKNSHAHQTAQVKQEVEDGDRRSSSLPGREGGGSRGSAPTKVDCGWMVGYR